jgi:hypothetical protein
MAEPVLATFADAGITTVLLKGAALIMTAYRDMSLRPQKDIDILVPQSQVGKAMDILEALHWRTKPPLRHPLGFHTLWAKSAIRHVNESGGEIDLHWVIRKVHGPADEDASLWQNLRSAHIRGKEFLILSHEDQLLHILDHAALDTHSPIRWIPDALHQIRAAQPEMDWKRFLARAMDQDMIIRCRSRLRYLQDRFAASLPEDLLCEIMRAHGSRRERLLNRRWKIIEKIEPSLNYTLLRPLHQLSYDPDSHKSVLVRLVLFGKLWSARYDVRSLRETLVLLGQKMVHFLKNRLVD